MELPDATEKTPATQGIDPGTFRLVAGCLNHYAIPGPSLCIFLNFPVTSSFLGSNTLLNTLFSNTHQTQAFHPEWCEVMKCSIAMAFQLRVVGIMMRPVGEDL